jgi:hypothetical protein
MALDLAATGKTYHAALTAAEAHVTIGNWIGVMILADVAGHLTIDGSTADQTTMPILANERLSLQVQAKDPVFGVGGGEVHFVKSTGAADGNIWITEAS